MPTDHGAIAGESRRAKQHPRRADLEAHTPPGLLGETKGRVDRRAARAMRILLVAVVPIEVALGGR